MKIKTPPDVINHLLKDKTSSLGNPVEVFAPSNIALIKYWGKRNASLNLPLTDSLSITLPHTGALTRLKVSEKKEDVIHLQNETLPSSHPLSQKASRYFDLFRPFTHCYYELWSESQIPIGAGLASSASGFAALAKALNELHHWQWTLSELSIAARLGSGSACRSFWNGFVLWQKGVEEEGMDSHGVPLSITWPALRIGLLTLSSEEKPLSSREGMNRTTKTSALYKAWPQKVAEDLEALVPALEKQDFHQAGSIVESNALAMHGTLMGAWPPISYSKPNTIKAMHHIWKLRAEGLPLYFTQDAGPNLKLLFLEEDENRVREEFPELKIIVPF